MVKPLHKKLVKRPHFYYSSFIPFLLPKRFCRVSSPYEFTPYITLIKEVFIITLIRYHFVRLSLTEINSLKHPIKPLGFLVVKQDSLLHFAIKGPLELSRVISLYEVTQPKRLTVSFIHRTTFYERYHKG